MFKKEKGLSLTKLFLRLSIALILSLNLISYPNPTTLASDMMNVKNYIKDKFPLSSLSIQLIA